MLVGVKRVACDGIRTATLLPSCRVVSTFVCRFCRDMWTFRSAFTAGGPIKVSTLVMINHATRQGIGAACGSSFTSTCAAAAGAAFGSWLASTCAAAAEARLRSRFRASCLTAAPTGTSAPFSHQAPRAAFVMVVMAAGVPGGANSFSSCLRGMSNRGCFHQVATTVQKTRRVPWSIIASSREVRRAAKSNCARKGNDFRSFEILTSEHKLTQKYVKRNMTDV